MSPSRHDLSRDQAAAATVRQHHDQLARGLDERVEALLAAIEQTGRSDEQIDRSDVEPVRQELLAYLRREIVPHAQAEERTLYPAAAAYQDGGALIEGMLGEHHAMIALIDELAKASPVRAVAADRALAALFAVHLKKENDLILPLLVTAADVSLADLLAGMHDLLAMNA